jgi:hypothetical protein
VPSLIALPFFPIIPFLYGMGFFNLVMHPPEAGLLSEPFLGSSLTYFVLFVTFFVGSWFGTRRWLTKDKSGQRQT